MPSENQCIARLAITNSAGNQGDTDRARNSSHESMAKRLPQGYYSSKINGTTWEVPDRYQELTPINSGAYGQVCSALDTKYGIRVAIKKLYAPFEHRHNAKKAYREMKILTHLKHENCIGLLDVFSPSEEIEEFSDFYMVMHLMSMDLSKLLKENRASQILSEDHIKFLLYQILCGLKYVHSAGIIHRDLKPSNIAVNPTCDLRILDFGLARQTDRDMTGYVSTRHYRAPEVMLSWENYGKQVDVWSVGCIMAELLGSKVLFPGDNQIDQLHKIFEIMGTPSQSLIDKIPHEKTRFYLQSLKTIKPKNLKTLLDIHNNDALDLLKKLLTLDPEKRITVDEALAHPYLTDYADPVYETTALTYSDEYEELELEASCWKGLVWKNIQSFTPDPSMYLLDD